MNFLKRNYLLIATTLAVAIIFVIVPFVVPHGEGQWPPTLGDWGDFIAGAMAVIVFLWLIAGHQENQRQIANTNRDLETQLELTREVAGALVTIAAGNKVQASEVLAEANPRFVSIGSTGGSTGRHTTQVYPTHGYFAFRNEGSTVTVDGVRVSRL